MVDAQVEAAYTYQSWGDEKPEYLEMAIQETATPRSWGWGALARRCSRRPDFAMYSTKPLQFGALPSPPGADGHGSVRGPTGESSRKRYPKPETIPDMGGVSGIENTMSCLSAFNGWSTGRLWD